MKFDKIRIAPYIYTLDEVKNLTGDDGSLLYGQITYQDATVRILKGKDVSEQRRAVAIIHEVLHGILEHAGLDSSENESIIIALGNGIFGFIRDNEEIIDYIRYVGDQR